MIPTPTKKALYSLQFYRDKEGTLNLLETGNSTGKKGSIGCIMSMVKMARELRKSHKTEKLLTYREMKCLREFFRTYLDNLDA